MTKQAFGADPRDGAHYDGAVRPTVSLVLGAGGARGLAGIGVFRALQDVGLTVGQLVGTSMGAVVGALICVASSPADLETRARSLRRTTFFAPGFEVGGVGSALRLRASMRSLLGDLDLNQLRPPLVVMCTDMNTGEAVPLRSGSLADAVAASCSIAGIHPPIAIGGRALADGGYSGPLHLAETSLARVVVLDPMVAAARPVGLPRPATTPLGWMRGAIDGHVKGIDIMLWRLSRAELTSRPHVLVRPELEGVSPFDFTRIPEIIEAGYLVARKALAANSWASA